MYWKEELRNNLQALWGEENKMLEPLGRDFIFLKKKQFNET
jgi:hypothetical protein